MSVMIRPFEPADWEAVWQILKPVFRAGTTYAYTPDITETEALEAWIRRPMAAFVAEENGRILGTYYLKPNQPGLGAHICNCGYAVSEESRGRGIASSMCEHSQAEAIARGFIGMQFNLVVSTNENAVRLWQKLGFKIIGTVPESFRHAEQGLVDAHIMFKKLSAV